MNVLVTDSRQIEAIRAITDRGHLVIPGEPCATCGGKGGEWTKDGPHVRWESCPNCDERDVLADGHAIRTRVLPSPWCDLPATCHRCGGRGWLFAPDSTISKQKERGCPDCVAGRPVHLLQAGKHMRPPTLSLERSGEAPCDDCIVDLGSFTVQIVPVVAKPSDSPEKACAVPLAQGMVLYWPDRDPSDLEPRTESKMIGSFDPLPVPGQFVAELVRQP